MDVHKIYEKLQRPSSTFISERPLGGRVEKRYDLVLLGKGEVKPFPPFEVELLSSSRTFIEEIGKEVVIEEMNRDQFKDYSGASSSPLRITKASNFH